MSVIMNTKEILRIILPGFVIDILKSLKKIIIQSAFNFKDCVDLLSGRREPLIPPERLIFIGSGDFKSVGDEFLKYFIKFGGLKKSDKVLDIGCGIGRMARPLVTFLDSNNGGKYYGFDIVSGGIDWCKINYKQYNNFHFELADIYNKHYNPIGKYKPSEFKFNFENNSFDFIFATSVFTHMLLQDVERYVSEISRVLKTNGNCFITFFILNNESKQLISSGFSSLNFKNIDINCWTVNESVPEDAIGYEEEIIKSLLNNNGLSIIEPIYYGYWCGREKNSGYQDIIVAKKDLK